MFMQHAYADLIALQGEAFSLTSPDASEAVALRGMYDRRVVVSEIRGAEVRSADHRVGVVSSALPAWARVGARLDIRSDALQVTALEPDGQGLTVLVCRAAK